MSYSFLSFNAGMQSLDNFHASDICCEIEVFKVQHQEDMLSKLKSDLKTLQMNKDAACKGGLYLAPHIPGGLRWSPGDFPESTWSPGAFFLAGSTAKLACIIHLDFTRTPGGLQMNHMESVESTCQIAVWILPGLTPGSIHLESRRSPFSSECTLLYS